MKSSFNSFEDTLNISMCGNDFKAYEDCLKNARGKKDTEKCKILYKNYQFCITKMENDRMNQWENWEKFKEKWGHYPSEEIEENNQ